VRYLADIFEHLPSSLDFFDPAIENLLHACHTMRPSHGLSVATVEPAFEAGARHLRFKLAARELHVTPGAVGQQVKALEVVRTWTK
jgi:hypothetical protein